MDHSTAHVMAWTNDSIVTTLITSDFTHLDKVHSMIKSENLMHNKEKQKLHGYFQKLSDVIREYNHVVLFGPTTAKTELLNVLKENPLFDKIIIEVVHADKMTENQEHAFVRKYFPMHGQKLTVAI
jgi:stalled ribosome rescue protein Dom34